MKFDRVINATLRLISYPNFNVYTGNLEIRNLRMAFSILKTESWATNKCTLRIWNLSADNRNRISIFGDEVRLSAGYRMETGAQLLFVGDTTQVSHIFAEPEIITVLACGDGDRSLNNILVSVSFGANIPVRTVIESIASQMQMEISTNLPNTFLVYANGFSDSGLAKDVLDNACNKAKIKWSVQNGKLVFYSNSGASPRPPLEINAENGMIGIPERYTDKRGSLYVDGPNVGWKVRTLLRPDIIPGDRVNVRSNRVNCNGLFYVISIEHVGDNFGSQFESLLELVAI